MLCSCVNSIIKSNYSYSIYRKVFFRSKYYARKPLLSQEALKKPRPRQIPLYGKEQRELSGELDVLNQDVLKKHRKSRVFPLFIDEQKKLSPKLDTIPKQKFDYFLILDFEATCDSPRNLDPPEIIEFPVLKVNGETFKTESTFHSYVKPELNPELSCFCTELTGIIQAMIDSHPTFRVVYQNFLNWMNEEEILKPGVKFAFVTCGDTDLDFFFPIQCKVSEIEEPEYMKRWINIKRSFCEISPYVWPDNLSNMLQYCRLDSQGELHSGIDDARNIARVLKDLAERGLVFDYNGSKNT